MQVETSNGSARRDLQGSPEKIDLSLKTMDGEEKTEVKPEPKKDELAELRAQLDEERKARETAESKAKDLGSRLTKEQQVRAEWERYHTQTLPQINRVVERTFEERMAENPHEAVKHEVNQTLAPINANLARANAETWVTQVMLRNPEMAKYEKRVVELSMESPAFAQMTYSKIGIEKLFEIAASEDIRKERDELKTKMSTNQEKSRALTEDSGARRTPSQGKQTKLSPAQMAVAKAMRMTPEQYLKGMEQVQSAGEVEFDE